MKKLKILFDNNQKWIDTHTVTDKEYFLRMSKGQSPKYLWIGCSDSRIPANEVVGLEPGELFVHRNVANLFLESDLNCMAVLQYAIEILKVEHVIVCGHYGCGGIMAAMENKPLGLIDEWLKHIRHVYHDNIDLLNAIEDTNLRSQKLVQLNVLRQVRNITKTEVAKQAWEKGQTLFIHGWIYDLTNGKLQDLNCCIGGLDEELP